MISPTQQETDEQYDILLLYEDYELNTLTNILQLIKNYKFCMFNMHQAERLMLDVYYATLDNPELGYTWTDEAEQHWISPSWKEFETNFFKLVARHEYHTKLENENFQRRLLKLPEKKPRYSLQLHYTP